MNKQKIWQLLQNQTQWMVRFNNIQYNTSYFSNQIEQVNNQLKQQVPDYTNEKTYLIAVGFNSFEYCFYILLASALGLNLILVDPKMLDLLFDGYDFNYVAVLSTRAIHTRKIKYISISLTTKPPSSLDFEMRSEQTTKTNTEKQSKLVFFTSGTTSKPKLIEYEENNLLQNALTSARYLRIKEFDRCLCIFPTHYMYGFSMLLCTLLMGGEIILERPTLTAAEIWQYLRHEPIKILPIIHSVLQKIREFIENENIFLPHLTIMNASDRIYVDDVKLALKLCPVFWNNFGQTESGPRLFAHKITSAQLDDVQQISHHNVVALGKTIDDRIEIAILDENDNPCDLNSIGKLHYRSPFAMQGYLDHNGNLVKKDWMHSGDLVFKDARGFIFWVGRENEIIKIDGKHVNISLLHQAFDQLEFVSKSYFSYDNVSEKLHAHFVLKHEHFVLIQEIDPRNDNYKNEIYELYRIKFPLYPRLSAIYFVKELPMTQTGKIKIRELINSYEHTES